MEIRPLFFKLSIPIFIFSTFLFLIFNSNILSDFDNPLVDHVPRDVLDQNTPTITPLPTVVTVDGYDNFDMGVDIAEGHISTNPTNPLAFFTAFNINGTHYSTSGHAWATSNPNFGFTMRGDPVTAYDSLGRLYYENMYGSSILGTKIISSDNNSLTWYTAVDGNSGGDKNWMAADQTAGPYTNYVYGTMTNTSFNGVNFIRSTNRGASFTNTSSFAFNPLPGSMPCVGPNGSTSGGAVYVVINSGFTFASTYIFHVSLNGGISFTLKSSQNWVGYVGTNVNGRNSVDNMRTRPYPFIAADNSYGTYRGRLYCVYATNDPPGDGNKPDIFCRYSNDQGATWSGGVKVNDDASTQNNNQWHPAIWCDKQTGRLYVQWMDTRDTPTSDSALIYATASVNGGVSFVPNQRISNKKMKIDCSTCGGGGTPRYQGDYNGITSNEYTSMLTWTDFRNGNFGSYAAYFPDFAFTVSPSSDSINSTNGSISIDLNIPAVKRWGPAVTFVTQFDPTPPYGHYDVIYPSGSTLNSFPGSRTAIITANNVKPGTYNAVLTASGPNGTPVHRRFITLYTQPSVIGIPNSSQIINKYELFQNYPNPFNPTTRIDYNLMKESEVSLTVYDILGKAVSEMKLGKQAPGKQFVVFNAANLSAGIYYYRLTAGDFTDVKKMILLK
ncbi:MAG: T9SS type A sorting domain-containing protein [Ignavibacteria bacterium]|nr:T9SS type A sorting domain-containing protein [Ignavibacteria bacterium]